MGGYGRCHRLALLRNLWLLGGGGIQKFWAWVGLLLIVGLFSLSAYLFRQVRFSWLAALLIFCPLDHFDQCGLVHPLPTYCAAICHCLGYFGLGLNVDQFGLRPLG